MKLGVCRWNEALAKNLGMLLTKYLALKKELVDEASKTA